MNTFSLAFHLIGIFALVSICVSDTTAETIIVHASGRGDYTTIQEAIDNATDGDTIRVWRGTYRENVVVNRTVFLIGNGSQDSRIDGEDSGPALTVESDGVEIAGFRMKTAASWTTGALVIHGDNITVSDSSFNARERNTLGRNCILIDGGNDVSITNSTLSGCDGGVDIRNSNSIIIQNSAISDSQQAISSQSSGRIYIGSSDIGHNNNGITISNGADAIIRDNVIHNNSGTALSVTTWNNVLDNNIVMFNNYGISLGSTGGNSTLVNNRLVANERNLEALDPTSSIDSSNTINGVPVHYLFNLVDGVITGSTEFSYFACFFCDNITISDVELSNNGYGLAFWNSSHINVTNSTLSNMTYGLSFLGEGEWSCQDCAVLGNDLHDNYYGIAVDGGSGYRFGDNRISRSIAGIYLSGATDVILESNEYLDTAYTSVMATSGSTVLVVNETHTSPWCDETSFMKFVSYLTLRVVDKHGNPYPGADVRIGDDGNVVYVSTGFGGVENGTGPAGQVPALLVTDRIFDGGPEPQEANVSVEIATGWYYENRTIQVEGAHLEIFQLPNRQPLITSVNVSPAAIELGQPVNLAAAALDYDGTVEQFVWNSSLAGWLGNGSSLILPDLPLGHHEISLTAFDDDGAGSEPHLVEVLVYARPTIWFLVPDNATAGETVNFFVTASDEDGHITSVAWDFDGDGFADLTTEEGGNVTHTYTAAGNYTVTVTVTDDDGHIATATAVVEVAAAEVLPPSAPPEAEPGPPWGWLGAAALLATLALIAWGSSRPSASIAALHGRGAARLSLQGLPRGQGASAG